MSLVHCTLVNFTAIDCYFYFVFAYKTVVTVEEVEILVTVPSLTILGKKGVEGRRIPFAWA